MVRKSFDIDKSDLAEARAQADALGISLFRYLQMAVKEKNDGASSLDLLQSLETRLVQQMDRMRTEMDRIRIDMRDDNDAMCEQLREQNQSLLHTTEAQMRGFMAALAKQLSDEPESAGDTPWSPETY